MKEHVYSENFKSFFDADIDVLELQRKKKGKGEALNTNDFVRQAKRVHGDRFSYLKTDYVNRSTNVIIICNDHDVEFFQTPTNHLSGWFGCPHCSYKKNRISKGERIIKEFLEKNKIKYVFQKRFDDCKYRKTLRFDFWLPEFMTLIEYDGEQHFISVDHWGGEQGLEERQIKDTIKNDYVSEKGINLLRIPYSEINNISDILNDFLRK